ncbi:hypothetical protein Theos_0355 [Thermus oshimai JL-2]|uniref:PD-(D/E)XK endonuclease-like domain-containing protein n=1 Tax=Thermus oshimai JL-2 TaxID=751945 RepID=K7QY14_THEOS|nr:hypothetical protein [Thermus oshimai]AFV75430.1 hypothetical protein Theos_0355 [Thermus oshimai JL-2]
MEPGLYAVEGPPASGKTELALAWAREVLKARGRVYWVGLPHQRAHVFGRLGREALLGLEFLSFQALYYRLLAEGVGLRPLLPGAGRVALVGEALKEVHGAAPAPGEARLFARAIAELKRFGLGPLGLPKEGEAGRLRRVFLRYEGLKRGLWDYDDFRHRALRAPLRLFPKPHLVVVDGFREVGPLDLLFLKRLSRKFPVLLTAVRLPEDLPRYRVLPKREVRAEVWALPNPVEETRHLLRALKRALAPRELGGEGLDPFEVLVVAPEERIPGLLLLKEEYGLPLFDGREAALSALEGGERLLALLNPHPTGADLLLLGFEALGRKALRLGLVGLPALEKLAGEEGLEGEFRAFLDLLPKGRLGWAGYLEWAEGVLDRLGVAHKPLFLERLRMALRVSPEDPLPWWRSLLLDETLPPSPVRGVAVVPPLRALGVRARRVYLLEWVEGRYTLGEREDYFFLEELRAEGFDPYRLPKRLRGLDPLFREEMASRGEEVYLLYPEAGLGGGYLPILQGERPEPLPPASRLEALPEVPFTPPPPRAKGPPRHLELLKGLKDCPFRAYLLHLGLGQRDGALGWHLLPRELEPLLAHPEVGPWLERHRGLWEALRFWEYWRVQDGLILRLDAVRREGKRVRLYRLLPPGEARLEPDRWTEWYAVGSLLASGVEEVEVWLWPWLGEPRLYAKPFRKGPDGRVPNQAREARQEALKAYREWLAQPLLPRPGSACFGCAFGDVCRKEAG